MNGEGSAPGNGGKAAAAVEESGAEALAGVDTGEAGNGAKGSGAAGGAGAGGGAAGGQSVAKLKMLDGEAFCSCLEMCFEHMVRQAGGRGVIDPRDAAESPSWSRLLFPGGVRGWGVWPRKLRISSTSPARVLVTGPADSCSVEGVR